MWSYGRFKVNLDKEETFKSTDLFRVFKMIFDGEENAIRVYRILKIIKEEGPYGFRIYGNRKALIKAVGLSSPTLHKLINKMIDVGLIEIVKIPSNVVSRHRIPDSNEIIMVPSEQKHMSKFLVISSSTKFSNTLARAIEQWIEFKKPPLITRLALEEMEKAEGKIEEK